MLSLMTDRAWKKATYTIGRFFVNAQRFCESLEDKDRGLTSSMDESVIKKMKVYGETAIPSGTYQVVLSYSNKFKDKAWAKKYNGLVPEIIGVKGFSGIRIHPLNYATQSEGCIGVGDNNRVGSLTNSVKRYCELMTDYIVPAWKSGQLIMITIK